MADISAYVEDIKNYVKKVDEDQVQMLAKSYRLAMSKSDTRFVACSQASERETIKKNFLRKKLGLNDATEAKLDKAIQAICEQMGSGNRRKSRITFYYLLSKKLKAPLE